MQEYGSVDAVKHALPYISSPLFLIQARVSTVRSLHGRRKRDACTNTGGRIWNYSLRSFERLWKWNDKSVLANEYGQRNTISYAGRSGSQLVKGLVLSSNTSAATPTVQLLLQVGRMITFRSPSTHANWLLEFVPC